MNISTFRAGLYSQPSIALQILILNNTNNNNPAIKNRLDESRIDRLQLTSSKV